MYNKLALASFTLLAAARGQQVGKLTAEVHPAMAMQVCATGGTCTTKNTEVVIDANWRWLHTTEGATNCYTGNTWDEAICPDAETCSAACAVDGADYEGTYGISTSTDSLTLKFITKTGTGTNIGSRVYLMADETSYQAFNLKNNEFTFDVDMSNLPCGLNGALYFSQMDIDGGMAKNPSNKAGAQYGTGYCDAQCPHDMKFINGEANLIDWTPSENDKNSGAGKYGTCCTEMDIWEANQEAAAYTPHACEGQGLTRCEGTDCGDADERYDGICDKDGCDFNSYRMGDKTFLGPGKTVDTKSKLTVVTQFITADGTDAGALTSIKRFYVQGGKTISNSVTKIEGVTETNEITDEFCAQQKSVFGDNDYFKSKGGMAGFSAALDSPMVLSMSIWDDHTADMKWLDSTYPVGATGPGAERGPCSADAGIPENVERDHPDASVTFSNIKFGPIGSTFSGSNELPTVPDVSSSKIVTSTKAPASSTKIATSAAPSAAPTGAAVAKYGQCGGIGYTGSKVCVEGSKCVVTNEYYSQCL